MLKTKKVNSLITDLVPIGDDITIDKVGNSKVVWVKIDIKTVKFKTKSKNLAKPFLAKSQSFAQSSGSGFVTPKARLAFIKLR